MALYFRKEILNDVNNLRRCDHCKSEQACMKSQIIDSLPPVLLIALKRYYTTNSKVSVHIQLPSRLDLNAYSDKKTLPEYELSAIICHKGSMNSGHYVAYCKNIMNSVWYKYDDKKVTQKTEVQILSQQVYIAFYTEIPSQKIKFREGDSFVPTEWL